MFATGNMGVKFYPLEQNELKTPSLTFGNNY